MQTGKVTILAPLNVPSLLGEDASELYSKNQYNLLELMLKDNVIKLDWEDEILAKTVLTHAGERKENGADKKANPVSKLKRHVNRACHTSLNPIGKTS